MNGYARHLIMKKHELTSEQDAILGYIISQDNDDVSVTKLIDICKLSVSSPATTHKYYKDLVNKGYIKEVPHLNDGRYKFAKLTPKGKSFIKEMAGGK